jgi:uncharacterized protein (UPF0335 family)
MNDLTPNHLFDMPETEADASARLKHDLERYEDLEREKADLSEHQKALLEALKSDGYDTAIFKKIVALRKKRARDLEEQATLMKLYMDALGIEIKGVIA